MQTALTHALENDDRPPINRHFQAAGAPAPRIVWRPTLADLRLPPLQGLLTYWEGLRGDAAMPSQDRIDPLDLRSFLGHIMLLDVVDDGADFRYRLYGSKIAARTGYDMTGKLVSQNQAGPAMGAFLSAGYRAVLGRREPLLTVHLPPPEISALQWSRLILPFVSRANRIERLMVGNIPGARDAAQ